MIILLAGVAGFFFLKHATERGRNAVRAYLYLIAIRDRCSVEEANQMAGGPSYSPSPETIRGAKLYAQALYGGKQLPMIADAKRQGLALR
ncbi:hypothetical protein IVB38_13850 [Bradyrhizobium sp. 38]|uniref:hypothetical protein n=1 Tax=unclassified Bradyrhizobium TaxID=2631580 RepID=UPI001FFAC19F|nr:MULTISPECIES: hypothetical protein [unclassified Bradyrhizobium]MCK1337079.1 hypothetical protein [Bradyrhizobium sp. 38]MCK1778354.1 hypothetical protein [Bradyrhizobium sp. 132]